MSTDDPRDAPGPQSPADPAGRSPSAGSAPSPADHARSGPSGTGTPDAAAGTSASRGAAPATGAAGARRGRKKVDLATNSRTARAWTGWIVGAIILIFLLVFIIQNSASTDLKIFAWHFSLPLGVAILLAAIVGALITALIGGARMLQMRRAARKVR